jgi:hypothetical protein
MGCHNDVGGRFGCHDLARCLVTPLGEEPMMLWPYELLGHLSNALYTVGYALKDVLWLRVFLVVGCAFEIVYSFQIAGRPLWVNISWAGLGMGLNAVQIALLLRERRAPEFTEEEQELFKTVFRDFCYADFRTLMRRARWMDVDMDTTMTTEGRDPEELLLIYRGAASVEVQGKKVAMVNDHHFVGEMSFLTQGVASATVRATRPTRCLKWWKHELRELMQHNPTLQAALQAAFNADLVNKLTSTSRERRTVRPDDPAATTTHG